MSYVEMRGFGDAASDYNAALVAYNNAVAAQAAQDAAFKSAMLSYNNQVASVQGQNSAAQSGYNAALAAWQAKVSARNAVIGQVNAHNASQMAATNAVVAATGVAVPSGYTGCLSATQKGQYQLDCNTSQASTSVRGLGRFGSRGLRGLGATTTNPSCAWGQLPQCQPMPPIPADPGPQPMAPSSVPLPPMPTQLPPIAIPPNPGAPPPNTPGSISVSGLLALAVVGGGVALYFTLRKKKAA